MKSSRPPLGNYGDYIYYEINGKRYLFNGLTGILEFDIHEDDQALAERLNDLANSGPSTPAYQPINVGIDEFNPVLFNIFVSSTCNMSCSYCINKGGTLGMGDRTMSRGTARKVISFLRDYVAESQKKSLAICLYGGEPMLNPGALLEILDALGQWQENKVKKLRLQLSTNGTIHDKEVLAAVKNLGDSISVVISLDGGAERHNTHRRFRNGGESWQLVYDYSQMLRREEIPFGVTAVVSYPYDYRQTAEELIALGFDEFEIKDVIPHSFGGMSPKEVFRWDCELWRKKYLEYEEFCLALYREGKGIHIVDRYNLLSQYKRCYRSGKPSLLTCGAGRNKSAIDTDGNIYPCEGFVHSDFILGNIHDGWRSENVTRFAKLLNEEGSIINENRECMGCFVKHLCRGGCYAVNLDRTGKINEIMLDRCEFLREKAKLDLYYLSEMQSLKSELSGEDSPAG